MPEVPLGYSQDEQRKIHLGDLERRSGLYILGKPGVGKSVLLTNIAMWDIYNKHKVFFLDPHADAIADLTKRFYGDKQFQAYLFDPEDREYSFGINLLYCWKTDDLTMVTDTYTRAYNVFFKLWEDSWGVWLQLILQNTLWALIEHGEYTLAEVPLFLNPQNEAFRKEILSKVKLNPACRDFWEYEFFQRRKGDQQERIDAALTRINTLLTHPYVRHIIGQKKSTMHFDYVFNAKDQFVFLFKLSANLSEDIKKFIGTIIFSELLHAVRGRMVEFDRSQLCIFVDEFQNFASSDDIRSLITEGRKFGCSLNFAHQERFGQFADQQKLMGATLAAVNKVLFQVTVKDASELAPEFAKDAPDTRTRLGGQLVNSPHAIEDIWEKGHPSPDVMLTREKYFWIVDLLKHRPEGDVYLFDPQKITVSELNKHDLQYNYFYDWLGYRATPEMLRRGISLLNKHYYDYMQNRRTRAPISDYELNLFLEIIDCFSGVYGFRQTMEAHISDEMRERLVKKLQDKQDNEIMEMRRKMEQNMLPRMLMYHAVSRGYAFNESKEGKELELQEILKRRHPKLLREWIVAEVPNYYIQDWEIEGWTDVAKEVFHPTEMEGFIIWEKRVPNTQERRILRELVRLAADMPIDNGAQVEVNQKRIFREYTAIMTYPFLRLRFGEKYNELPFETIEPLMRVVAERIAWQLIELQSFIFECLRLFPWYLAQAPIQIQSAQYDEEPKREKTQGEMIDIMAQELTNLPRFTAYAKIIEERDGKQSVWKDKIQTYNLPVESPTAKEDAVTVIENGHSWSTKRSDVEKEIRGRQEQWREEQEKKLRTGKAPTPSKPPPTSE
jgi:hypothetical protein